MAKKQYVVIGLGIFGATVARTLCEHGQEVLAIDLDISAVESIADAVTKAVQADATDIEQLRALGVQDFDTVIVAIGDKLETSVLAIMNARELGVKYILAKANNDRYGEIMEKVGADRVVQPEKDIGDKLARSLLRNHIVDLIELSGGYSVVEIRAPQQWVGQSIAHINVRAMYGFNIIGCRESSDKDFNMSIDPARKIAETDTYLMVAKTDKIEKFDFQMV